MKTLLLISRLKANVMKRKVPKCFRKLKCSCRTASDEDLYKLTDPLKSEGKSLSRPVHPNTDQARRIANYRSAIKSDMDHGVGINPLDGTKLPDESVTSPDEDATPGSKTTDPTPIFPITDIQSATQDLSHHSVRTEGDQAKGMDNPEPSARSDEAGQPMVETNPPQMNTTSIQESHGQAMATRRHGAVGWRTVNSGSRDRLLRFPLKAVSESCILAVAAPQEKTYIKLPASEFLFHQTTCSPYQASRNPCRCQVESGPEAAPCPYHHVSAESSVTKAKTGELDLEDLASGAPQGSLGSASPSPNATTAESRGSCVLQDDSIYGICHLIHVDDHCHPCIQVLDPFGECL